MYIKNIKRLESLNQKVSLGKVTFRIKPDQWINQSNETDNT